MFGKMIEALKNASPKKLVFTEGLDERILEASSRLQKEGLITPILIGKPDEVQKIAQTEGFDISGIEIIDPMTYPEMDTMVEKMVELRKGKMSLEECKEALAKSNYFGTMLVKMGLADGLLGGATYSTSDTVRPALQLVKTKPENKIVSSSFILSRETDKGTELYAMADCAINLDPSAEELVEIATETAQTAMLFGIEPKVAMLSYSTLGSGKGDSVDKVQKATEALKAMNLPYPVDGELQFDAAFSPDVADIKAPSSKVAGKANTFVFPEIDAGNIGYKIAQRLGGFDAFGPILQGLNAPINDLSRGCNADEVYHMALITASLAGNPDF